MVEPTITRLNQGHIAGWSATVLLANGYRDNTVCEYEKESLR